MQSSLSLTRSRLFRKYSVQYQTQTEINAAQLAEICDAITVLLLPRETLEGKLLSNIKGVDSNRWSKAPQSSEEIMLRAEGAFFSSTQNALVHSNLFEIKVTTQFDSFKGNHRIFHRANISELGGLSDYIPAPQAVRVLGKLFPLEIHRLQFGIEFFKSQWFTSFGFSPVAEESFLINASASHFSLEINAENLATKDTPLFQIGNYHQTLAQFVKTNFQVDLWQDYGRLQQLQSQEKSKLTIKQ